MNETINKTFYENQIKGLILIMEKDDSSFVTRKYVIEKLNMILNGGIGFHSSIKKLMRNKR